MFFIIIKKIIKQKIVAVVNNKVNNKAAFGLNSLLLTLLSLILLSCGGASTTIRPGDTMQEAFIKANRLFELESYGQAAEAFETVVNLGRATEFGRESQFKMAESYFHDGRYMLAASEFKRYREFYPRADKLPEADFKRALSYYKMSPRYKLDQENSKKAIELFNLFISRYPENDKVDDADGYIQDLRNKLAHKNYSAAQLYLRLEQYKAAAIYLDVTINQYPDSKWAEKALAEQINTYVLYANRSVQSKKAERYKKAVESYEKYLQLFPNGKNRSNAEDYYEAALNGLENLENNVGSQTASNANTKG